MAILNSCCCWKSVRRGSFAVAVYSLLYYSVLAWFLWPAADNSGSVIMQEEQGEDAISHLSRPMFILSLTGLLTCFLLFLGLCKDKAWLLLPWITVQGLVVVGDVVAAVYLVWVQELTSYAAITFTLDFFLLVLNLYAILCVTSQFQEYRAGRGTARDEEALSQDVGGRSGSFLLPPSTSPTRIDIKKHVQFPTPTTETEQSEEENNKNKEQQQQQQQQQDEEQKQEQEEEEEKKKEEKQEDEKEEEEEENKATLPSSSSFPPPSSSSSPSSSPPSPPQTYPADAPLLKITRY